jgi:hypothetical protein
MSIQTAIEKELAQLDGEIMSIDMMAQVVVSRRPVSKVPGKPDERYMVHNFSTNHEMYGKLFWGHYDLTPAQAMESLVEKIQKETKTGRQDTDENYQRLGDDIVTFKPCDLFATPDTLQDVHDYIDKFSGGELTAATVCAYMMYNWCAKMSNPATRPEVI